MKDVIGMSQRDRQRYHVLRMVNEGKLKLFLAAQSLGISYRQAKRMLGRYRLQGAQGIVHRSRGRPSHRRLDTRLVDRILKLSAGKYEDFNDSHFTQKLLEVEGIRVSREMVRQLRRAHGIKAKRHRRPRRHHKRRERRSNEGMMIQVDGSPHRWFGKDFPPCCLISAVDDATARWLVGFFIEFECSYGYFMMLDQLVTKYGIPASIYHDYHGSMVRNDSHWTIEEELAGEREPTQVGRALRTLGITSIPASSPQAKGRIERHFGVQQDRLVAELALRGIHTILKANAFLAGGYIEEYNRLFARQAQSPELFWRKPSRDLDLRRILSFHYQCVVGNDNAVRIGGHIIDIPPGKGNRGYAKAVVEVCQLLDGSWRVYHKDVMLATAPPTPIREPIRALCHDRPGVRARSKSRLIYMASAI